jgi:hypothetical protein
MKVDTDSILAETLRANGFSIKIDPVRNIPWIIDGPQFALVWNEAGWGHKPRRDSRRPWAITLPGGIFPIRRSGREAVFAFKTAVAACKAAQRLFGVMDEALPISRQEYAERAAKEAEEHAPLSPPKGDRPNQSTAGNQDMTLTEGQIDEVAVAKAKAAADVFEAIAAEAAANQRLNDKQIEVGKSPKYNTLSTLRNAEALCDLAFCETFTRCQLMRISYALDASTAGSTVPHAT